MDKNLLKSDKKLKEQVSEKLKNIGVQISQGTAATPQDRYTVCGVLSRWFSISFVHSNFTSFHIQ